MMLKELICQSLLRVPLTPSVSEDTVKLHGNASKYGDSGTLRLPQNHTVVFELEQAPTRSHGPFDCFLDTWRERKKGFEKFESSFLFLDISSTSGMPSVPCFVFCLSMCSSLRDES
ncbi:hypothetical protein H0G86_013180 [Trichoderma simmonsii]|uniref:Uncharacterized protein n=1 Tax=Trichoderma simmonsii TaxID=1491479 RepID=A0A8G0PLV5_9HYPO|nr:hypothetical protein H0G86_013180 [Trichoderma simmonsii]